LIVKTKIVCRTAKPSMDSNRKPREIQRITEDKGENPD
jgi:hypothetical protein